MAGELDIVEYQILNACADDWELFYFPFAEVNFGGQLSPGESRRIEVPGGEIAGRLPGLIHARFLACFRVGKGTNTTEVPEPDEIEFAVYDGYSCATFDEHLERFGYGPHEFKTTEAGVEEIGNPEYDSFAEKLGWD